jgi:hypothetical protein
MVQHPAWREYWKENSDKPPMSLAEDRRWFDEHGLNRSGIDIDTDDLPDEEIICDECEGNGTIESEVDLFKALKAYEEMKQCAADIGDAECTCGWH